MPSLTFDKPTLVLTAQHDVVFCGDGSRVLGVPDCGEGERSQLEAVRGLHPNVPGIKLIPLPSLMLDTVISCIIRHWRGSRGSL